MYNFLLPLCGEIKITHIGIHTSYTPQISLPYKYLCCFFIFDPGQIRYRASVRLSSCFFYLHTTIYTPPQMKFLATPLNSVSPYIHEQCPWLECQIFS